MAVASLTITGILSKVKRRPSQPLMQLLTTTTTDHRTPISLYQQAIARYAATKQQVADHLHLEHLIPASPYMPADRVYQQASPWRSSLIEVLKTDHAATAGNLQTRKNLTRQEWQLYFYYVNRYWRPYWPLALLSSGMLMGMSLYGMIYATMLKGLLDKILVAKGGIAVLPILIKLLALLPLAFAATILGEWLAGRLSARLTSNMRYDLFAHLQAHSIDYYKQNKLGDILAHFASDIPNIEHGMGRALMRVFAGVLTIVAIAILLFWIEWHLALYLLCAFPLGAYLTQRHAPDSVRARRAQRDADGLTVSMVEEGLRAHAMIQSFGLRQFMQDAYWARLQELEQLSTNAAIKVNFMIRRSEAASILVDVSAISLGVLMLLAGALSFATLVAFQSLLVTLRSAFTSTINDTTHIINAMGSIGRVDRLLQSASTVIDDTKNVLPPFRHEIRFENVMFSYTSQQQLQQLNLTIPAGHFVAFVGPSGAGKSTILSLLLRFYDVTAGRLTIDNHDIRTVTQASLRANMGVVLQDTFMFNATIFDNIRVVKPHASEAEVVAAAKAAELHEFIMRLPENYQTHVGEAGSKLSGGQKQRIAIARAMLVNPAILLLDEATSGLDADTAAAINATLQKIARTRTIIAITHHLAGVINADQIYVLQQGQVVEQGTHQTLLVQNGVYTQLWHTQNGKNEASATASS